MDRSREDLRVKSMARLQTIRWALVFGMSIGAAAQASSQSQSDTAPAPAFGQNSPVLNPENPPVTGLDEPGLELKTATRSFVSPALQVSESADTNAGNQVGGSGLESVTRVLGALDLQQFWPKSDLFLEYLGGGAFYGGPFSVQQVQAAGLEAVTRWRTGQLTLRDGFSYLPDGSFAIGTYGGVPGLGLATGGLGTGGQGGGLPGTNNFSSGQLGSIANIPRLANTAILDAVQALSPVSAITLAGGFSNAHFYDPTNTLINSDQITVEGGYSHLLGHRDQIGVIYGFQLFQFPQATGGQIYNHIVNVRWSHTISGRMSLIIGVGPQYTDLQDAGTYAHWTASGRAQLRYKFAHAALVATYEKFTSAGSGFFAGADTQAARLGFQRPLGRTFDLYADLDYSNNKKLQTLDTVEFAGIPGSTYNEGSAGGVLRKHMGRAYDLFAAYRFSEVAFDVPLPCGSGFGCGKLSQRNVGTVGVEWHPRPTRIE
jgi:hypothetical protein